MIAEEFRSLLLSGDVDELIRHVDRLADSDDWDELDRFTRSARSAQSEGIVTWPAVSWAAYRICLSGPLEQAVAWAEEDPATTIGPLHEVLASRCCFDEVAELLTPGPIRARVAQERVVRGENLTGHEPLGPFVELPLVRAGWEPDYLVATYRAGGIEEPAPRPLRLNPQRAEPATPIDDAAPAALETVVEHRRHAGTRVRSLAVRGDGATAAATLLGRSELCWADVDIAEASTILAWLGSCGGPGRRRSGAAAGRERAWWAWAGVLALTEDWPLDELPVEDMAVGVFGNDERPDPAIWRLAVTDLEHGVSCAIEIIDEAGRLP